MSFLLNCSEKTKNSRHNWEVVFNDNRVQSESDVGFWDNVDFKDIRKVEFYLADNNLSFEDFDRICISKIGMSTLGEAGSDDVGYVITVVVGRKYSWFRIRNGRIFSTGHDLLEALTIPEQCFRRKIQKDGKEENSK